MFVLNKIRALTVFKLGSYLIVCGDVERFVAMIINFAFFYRHHDDSGFDGKKTTINKKEVTKNFVTIK